MQGPGVSSLVAAGNRGGIPQQHALRMLTEAACGAARKALKSHKRQSALGSQALVPGWLEMTVLVRPLWKDSHREHAELAQDVSEVVVDPLTYQLVLLELIQAGHSGIE